MPHIHLEYSENLHPFDAKPVLTALNRAFFESGYVSNVSDIKSRAVCQEHFVIGLGDDRSDAYLHAKVSLLAGRSMAVQQEISALLLSVLQQQVLARNGLRIQMCVEMLEMNKETYSKQIVK
ncbi:5-carboxymethyl-2-hydroxymuconate Delta-isomerase [Acinetobacter sp.]|uniref:5-carboxymethyl-2-hydroxymuconate Delta-isomerase n=1 Tax=Acinetobacter sp. TaxID=472 RepID=UPI0035B1F726